MKLTHAEVINLVIIQDIHRLNQSFITLAIKEWDDHGQGGFAPFIQLYVFWCWCRLTRLN